MAFRDRFGRFVERVNRAHPPTEQELSRAGRFIGRQAYRGGRSLSGFAGRKAIGLTPSEYKELRFLRKGKQLRGWRNDETYIPEVRRLNELEAKYLATTSRRKGQARKLYHESARLQPYALRRYIKRLRA